MKSFLLKCLLVIICFFSLTLYFYIIKNDDKNLTVFQVGAYRNLSNANLKALEKDGIVYKENDTYNVLIAAYSNDDVIIKMQNYYDNLGEEYYLKKIHVDDEYLDLISRYENMILYSSDESIYSNLNKLLISSIEEYL